MWRVAQFVVVAAVTAVISDGSAHAQANNPIATFNTFNVQNQTNNGLVLGAGTVGRPLGDQALKFIRQSA
jgi:hypothetical protein